MTPPIARGDARLLGAGRSAAVRLDETPRSPDRGADIRAGPSLRRETSGAGFAGLGRGAVDKWSVDRRGSR